MSEHSVIIWDLKTVPDLAAAARLLDEGWDEAWTRWARPKHPIRWRLGGGRELGASEGGSTDPRLH